MVGSACRSRRPPPSPSPRTRSASRWLPCGSWRSKQSAGKLRIDGDLREQVRAQSFLELPVLGERAVAVVGLPLHHRDPIDRMLAAQAGVEGLTLLTADPVLSAYDVAIMAA